jgi:hypothetical protein
MFEFGDDLCGWSDPPAKGRYCPTEATRNIQMMENSEDVVQTEDARNIQMMGNSTVSKIISK